jgi:hypothetical protein
MLLLLAVTLPFAAFFGFRLGLSRASARRRRMRAAMTAGVPEAEQKRAGSVPRWLEVLMNILLVLGWLLLVTGTLQVNSSVFVWRQFHTDMRILTPYVSAEQRDVFVSRFSRMQAKADFESLMRDLRAVAEAKKVRLWLE